MVKEQGRFSLPDVINRQVLSPIDRGNRGGNQVSIPQVTPRTTNSQTQIAPSTQSLSATHMSPGQVTQGRAGRIDIPSVAPNTVNRVPVFVAQPGQSMRGLDFSSSTSTVSPVSQRLGGITTRAGSSAEFKRTASGSIDLTSGSMLVSVSNPSKQAKVQTPLGQVWVGRDGDALVSVSDGVLRVQSLSGTSDTVKVQPSKSVGSPSSLVSVQPGFEFVAGKESLSATDLSPADNLPRRATTVGASAEIGVSEISLPAVLRSNNILSDLRKDSDSQSRKIVDRIVKTAAIQLQTRGPLHETPRSPERASDRAREVSNGRPFRPVSGPPGEPPSPPGQPPGPPGSGPPPAGGPPAQQAPIATAPGTSNAGIATATDTAPIPRVAVDARVPTDVTRISERLSDSRRQSELRTATSRSPDSATTARRQDPARYGRSVDLNQQLPINPSLEESQSQPPVIASTDVSGREDEAGVRRGTREATPTINENGRPHVIVRTVIQRYPEAVAAALLVIAVLLAVSIYLARTAFIRAKKIEQLNTDLQSNVAELGMLNRDLGIARDQALQASMLKSEFVANISHELRTPLSAVLGMNALLRDSELNKEQKDFADQVDDSARTLLGLVNDLLDFSKIEAGKLVLERVPFSAASVVSQVIDMVAVDAGRKKLKIVKRIEGNVPETLIGDPTRLRQVLLNIVGNAVKFTEKGQVSIHAHMAARSQDSVLLRLSVRDTGIGISEAAMGRLFKPFVQADGSTTRRYGGTGLGLSISRRLVELMGGSIQAESQPGQGSHFSIMVPFERPSEETVVTPEGSESTPKAGSPAPPVVLPEAHPTEARPATQPAIAAGTILVAEDSQLLQRIVEMQLQKLGYSVHVVGTGKEAVEEAAKGRYAAILMDWQMPDMDGLQATKLIRDAEQGTEKHVPIIALTAHAMKADRESCIAAGMDDYLSKPFSREQLQEVLERWATT